MDHSAVDQQHTENITPDDLGIQDHGVDHLNLTNRIKLKHRVTGGGYSDIWNGTLRGDDDSNSEIAVKQLLVRSWELSMPYKVHLQRRFCREILLWNKLSHPNIVPLLGFVMSIDGSTAFPALISPWYTKGDIVHHLTINPQADRKQLLLDIATGLQYLHRSALIHGDVKGGNVLVDANGRASLCDFGMSSFVDQVPTALTTADRICGTQRFMCPELLNSQQKTLPTDIWAFGCVAIQVMLDRIPYAHKRSQGSLYKATISGEPPILEREVALSPTDETLWHSVQKCWSIDPFKRPTISQLVVVISSYVNASPPASIDITDHVILKNLIKRRKKWMIFRGSLNDGVTSQVVVKVLRVANHQTALDFPKEEYCKQIRRWSSLRHPNIVPILGYTNNPSVAAGAPPPLVLPFYENGDAKTYLRLNTASAIKFRLLLDAARGLRYLHHSGIVHGNIRVSNILVNADGGALLSNYESSSLWQMISADIGIDNNTSDLSVRYMAPEIIAEQPKTYASDIWAFGCLSTQVVTGDIPFKNITVIKDVMDAIKQGQSPTPFEEKLSDLPHVHLWSSIRKCWNYDPDERPMIAQVFSALADLEPLPDLKDLDLTQKIELREKVADGGYSVVFLGILNFDRKVAVKALRVSHNTWQSGMATEERLQKRFYREVMTWNTLTHSNIVPLLGFALISDVLPSLISPWYENSTVAKYVRASPDADRTVLLLDVIRGLNYLHGRGLIHGDLKTDNILVNSDGEASIADFGLSKFVDDEQHIKGLSTAAEFHGNIRFVSPETLDVDAITPMTDVWAFGCAAIEIMKDLVPYHCFEGEALVATKIMAGVLPYTDEESVFALDGISLWTEIRLCWNFNPAMRPEMQGLLTLCQDGFLNRDRDHSLPLLPYTRPLDLTDRVEKRRKESYGGVSDVWRGILSQEWGELEVAVKTLRISSRRSHDLTLPRAENRLLREAFLWSQTLHPNVVPFLGVIISPSEHSLVSPWYRNGNVVDYLQKHPSANRLQLVTDIATGLFYLHKIGIVHGDVKGYNVLINEGGHAGLCDFGQASFVDSQDTVHGFTTSGIAGTILFMAPERLNGEAPTTLSDIWGFGCVVTQVMLERMPYHELSQQPEIMRALISGLPPLPIDWQYPVDQHGFWNHIRQCWNKDPFRRPAMGNLLATIREINHSTQESDV